MSLDRQIETIGAGVSEPRLDTRDKTMLATLFASQAFWVTVALVVISGVMSIQEPVFASEDNFFNITRNFAFIGIMALGMTPVIITNTAVSEGMPPIFSAMPMAIGVVTDFGAIDR